MNKHFALAGNPNSGKTTLFNSLTGATAHVGNWPGVTVDKREGTYKKLAEPIDIVDLPGIYSLSPYTSEEIVSRNYILDEKPDCVIDIVDATNLERNLYLTTQLLEIDVPVVVALNMSDVLRKRGTEIKIDELSKRLGVPVVAISALKGENLDELMVAAYQACEKKREGVSVIENKDLAHLIGDVKIAFEGKEVANPLFHAVKLVELDEIETEMHPDLLPMVEAFKKTFEDDTFGSDFEALIADARYAFISQHFHDLLPSAASAEKDEKGKEKAKTTTDKIDRVLTHRVFGLIIFAAIMFLIFHFTFSENFLFTFIRIENPGVINFFTGMASEDFAIIDEATEEILGYEMIGIPSPGVWLQSWFGWFTDSLIIGKLGEVMPEAWYTSLLLDGILGGLSAVMSFIPQILLLFLFIGILEDSGYMARIAFILDRAFRRFGLSGKAFIPMLTGFGCSVPAIMATRTLEDDREKKLTIRLMTCFSCGAKAPIWALLATVGALAGFQGDVFVFTIYLGGILAAVLYAIILKFFSKDTYVSPFVMELPEYHLPQFRNVMALLWEKLKHYVIKAGTIILACTIVIWFLSNFGWNFWAYNSFVDEEFDMQWSILGTLGQGFRFFYYPLGCLEGGWTYGEDGWKYAVSIITGLIAKEDVVATMAELGLVEGAIALNAAGVYSFAAYNLFTIPCFAAIGAAHGELKGKEFWLTLAWWFGMSYVASAVLYWAIELWILAWWGGLLLTLALLGCIVWFAIVVEKRNKAAALAAKAE